MLGHLLLDDKVQVTLQCPECRQQGISTAQLSCDGLEAHYSTSHPSVRQPALPAVLLERLVELRHFVAVPSPGLAALASSRTVSTPATASDAAVATTVKFMCIKCGRKYNSWISFRFHLQCETSCSSAVRMLCPLTKELGCLEFR